MKKELKINNLKIENLFFSDCREITGNELYTINGGKQVENLNEGVANAQPGDTINAYDMPSDYYIKNGGIK